MFPGGSNEDVLIVNGKPAYYDTAREQYYYLGKDGDYDKYARVLDDYKVKQASEAEAKKALAKLGVPRGGGRRKAQEKMASGELRLTKKKNRVRVKKYELKKEKKQQRPADQPDTPETP